MPDFFKLITTQPLRSFTVPLIAGYRSSAMEQKLLNIVLGFGIVLTLISAGVDVFLGTGFAMVATNLTCASFLAFLYYLANNKKKYRLTVFLLIATAFYILIPVSWIFNAGTQGGMMAYIILLSSMSVTLCKGRGRLIAVSSLFLVISALLLFEYLHPDLLIGYNSRLARFQDIYVTLIMAALANSLLFIIVLREYNKERLQLEKSRNELLYLSYHDALTGVCNRTFFESELKTGKRSNTGGAAVFVIDIDGLKLINDTFGHAKGDKLLIQTVHCLKESFGDPAAICRIGGDEFAVLLQNVSSQAVENYYKNLQECIQKENSNRTTGAIPLHMSIGFAYSAESKISFQELFRQADNQMYRKKLSLHVGGKGSIIHTIQQILSARDTGTGEHVDRTQQLTIDFARMIGMAESEMADLQLFAEFHDIGKVGVPDRILNKPGPLTVDERAEMEKHTEIGFRIAQSLPELRPIAEWILGHHEWWDGNGYPLGIGGEAIPLVCRILAIVDAYDAMRSDRPYRSALTRSQAIAEIGRCAGSQFDPLLTRQFIKFIEAREEEERSVI